MGAPRGRRAARQCFGAGRGAALATRDTGAEEGGAIQNKVQLSGGGGRRRSTSRLRSSPRWMASLAARKGELGCAAGNAEPVVGRLDSAEKMRIVDVVYDVAKFLFDVDQ